jgi:regulator of sirC expression with transglutaminase-like and TPR domain
MVKIKQSIRRFIFWCLDGLIEVTPENAYSIVRRGYFRADCGDYDGGIADFSKAIELVPNYGDAYRIRARTYLLRK